MGSRLVGSWYSGLMETTFKILAAIIYGVALAVSVIIWLSIAVVWYGITWPWYIFMAITRGRWPRVFALHR